MKHKITRKLVSYFSFTLLVFAIIIGLTFSSMFKQSTKDQARADLQLQAQTIAQSLSIYLSEFTQESTSNHMMNGHGMRQRRLSQYLDSLETFRTEEIWVVDEAMNTINRTHNTQSITTKDLPIDAQHIINDALNGDIQFSDGFSDLLQSESISIAVPIRTDNDVIGAVLLHAPIAGIDGVIEHGYHVLVIYIALALLLSVALAYFLSMKFVKPLHRMQEISKEISDGIYEAQTNIKQNDEIGDLARSIDILAQKLKESSLQQEQLDRLRNDFFADISHELRTPVTVIKSALETLHQTGDTQNIDDYQPMMIQEVTYLQKLINDLLDFSKLNAIDFKLHKTTICMNDVISDAMRTMRVPCNQKNINIEFDSDPLPVEVFGDYSRLRQMITILIDNAIKFSNEEGSIEIHLNSNKMTIKDYGSGISNEELPFIFDRFVKSSEQTNSLGNGIGLAIAKQIAVRHNMEISVESKVDSYTLFSVIF